MDERTFQEMRKSLETQFKQTIRSQPGFPFFHSIGNTNFFQGFKSDDGTDFGVLHVYWDKEWRHRWLKKEDGYPVVAPFGNSPISEEGWQKIMSEHNRLINKSATKKTTRKFEKEQELNPPILN